MWYRHVLSHLVGLHCPLCTVECLLRKLFDIGLTGKIIGDSVVVGVGSLCGLELVHEVCSELEALLVDIVEALAEDLIDSPVQT